MRSSKEIMFDALIRDIILLLTISIFFVHKSFIFFSIIGFAIILILYNIIKTIIQTKRDYDNANM